jgi:D-aminoacyl-tRNA deacylase
MRAVCQRVSRARVLVEGQVVGEIGLGWAVLLGIGPDDGDAEASWLADKVAGLRVFEDEAGKMNRSAADVGAEILIVSQFTLYARLRKSPADSRGRTRQSMGRRSGTGRAAAPTWRGPRPGSRR